MSKHTHYLIGPDAPRIEGKAIANSSRVVVFRADANPSIHLAISSGDFSYFAALTPAEATELAQALYYAASEQVQHDRD